MKRMLILLAALLILLPACALGESPWESYDEIVDFARARYGYTPDDGEYPFLDYLPIYVDPVAYFGYINHDHGVKDGELFIIQRGRTAGEVSQYLEYLKRFGYYITESISSGTQDNWTLVMQPYYDDVASVPPTIRIEYLRDLELLVVRYAHGYGLVNRVWRSQEMTGDMVFELDDPFLFGQNFRFRSARLVDGADYACSLLPSVISHMDAETLEDRGLTIRGDAGSGYAVTLRKGDSHWARYEDAHVLLVELEGPADLLSMEHCFIVERAPEEGVVLKAPLFAGEIISEEGGVPALQANEEAERFWLAFPVMRLDPDMPLRLYLDFAFLNRGRPIEYWYYLDFMLP